MLRRRSLCFAVKVFGLRVSNLGDFLVDGADFCLDVGVVS